MNIDILDAEQFGPIHITDADSLGTVNVLLVGGSGAETYYTDPNNDGNIVITKGAQS